MRARQCDTRGCTSYATRNDLCAACRHTEADEAVNAVAYPSCQQPVGLRCRTRTKCTVVFASPRLRFDPHVSRLQLFRQRKVEAAPLDSEQRRREDRAGAAPLH